MPDDEYSVKATVKVDADTSEAEKKIKELPKLLNYLFDTVYNRSKYTKFDIEEVVESLEKLGEKQQEVNNQFGRLFGRRHKVDVDSGDLDKLYKKFRATSPTIFVDVKRSSSSENVISDVAESKKLSSKVVGSEMIDKKTTVKIDADASMAKKGVEEVINSFDVLNKKQQEVNSQFEQAFHRRYKVNVDSSNLDGLYHKFKAISPTIFVDVKRDNSLENVVSDVIEDKRLDVDNSKSRKNVEEIIDLFGVLSEKQQKVNNQFGRIFRRRHRIDIDSSDLDRLYHRFRALRTALTVNAKEIGLPKDVMADLARFEVLLNKVASGKIKNKKALGGIKDEAEAIITQLTLLQKGKISPEEFKKSIVPILRSVPLPKEYVPEQPATLLEANAGLEGLYDVLKKSKATRFQRTLDLFIASVFDAISASFDKGVATVVSKSGSDVTSYLRTQQIGRMIGASMVNPQSFATIFAKVVESETPLAREFMDIAERVGLKIQQSPEGKIEAVGGNIRGFIVELMKRSAFGKITGGESDKALASGLAVGYLQSLTIGVSGLMAKVGVVGVIVNKILEIFMRLMALSGSLQATVKMIGLFIQMTLKPLADLLASLFMPLVMMLMPIITKMVKWWNDLYRVWMQNAMHDRKLTSAQMASALAGFLKGGLWGGLAGALAPMMAYYGYKKSGWEAKTIGAIGLGLESITLTGDLKVFSVSSIVVEGIKKVTTNGDIIVKGAKTVIEWITANKGGGTQPSSTGGGGGFKPPVVVTSGGDKIKSILERLGIMGGSSAGATAVEAGGVSSALLGTGIILGGSYLGSKVLMNWMMQNYDTNSPLAQTSTLLPSGSAVTPSIDVTNPKIVVQGLENAKREYTIKHEVEVNVNAPDLNDPKYQEELRRIFEEMYSEQLYNSTISRG